MLEESTEQFARAFAQPGASMFERNVAHAAAKEKEVRVVLYSPSVEYTGFYAGLDEDYVQMCRTDNQNLVNIDRDSIVIQEETGKTLRSMERDKELDSYSAQQIRGRISHFVGIAKGAVGTGRND